MEIFVYVCLEFAWKLHFWCSALLFLCLYLVDSVVYYHFCNLTTTESLTLGRGYNPYFLAQILPKYVLYISIYDAVLLLKKNHISSQEFEFY